MNADPTVLLTSAGPGVARAARRRARQRQPVRSRSGCGGSTRPTWSRRRRRSMSFAWRPRAKFSRASEHALHPIRLRAGLVRSRSRATGRKGSRRRAPCRRPLLRDRRRPARARARAGEALAVDRDEVHARLALHNAGVYGEAGQRARARHGRARPPPGRASTRCSSTRLAAPAQAPPPPDQPPHPSDQAPRSAGRGAASVGAGTASAGRGAPSTGRSGHSSGAAQRFRGQAYPSRRSTGASRLPTGCPPSASRPLPACLLDLLPEGWEAEFIADGRDLKEAVLWSPALATAPRAPASGRPAPRHGDRAASRRLARTLVGAYPVVHPGDPVPLRSRGSTCSTRTRPSPGPALWRISPARSPTAVPAAAERRCHCS